MAVDTTTIHPLDPASVDELAAAVAAIRATDELSERAFFAFGQRVEPSRDELAAHTPGAPFDRMVSVVGHDPEAGKSFEVTVSSSTGDVSTFTWVDEGQAPICDADVIAVYMALAEHNEWNAALAKRGIDDTSLVHIEPWMAGVQPPEMPTGRVMRAFAFLHRDPDDNYYAYPIEGLIALVNVDTGDVVVDDHGVVPIPDTPAEYASDRVPDQRDDIKPLDITQPEGPSFVVDDHTITWQNWHLRISVHPVEGLVLHDVRYRDGDRDRPILHRAALSDMVVPYGDASPLHYWKHALDAGETSLGQSANSLTLGCDCLGEIYYFDAAFLGSDGVPIVRENTVCLHEEDFGILWKHTNPFRPDLAPEVRRSRRLVVSTIHTIGNYEYGFYWYFYLDGTIQLEMKLTGIIGVSVAADGVGSDTSPLVAPSISSPIHQHMFCFRLDVAVDGPANTVVETNVEVVDDGAHPYGAGFRSVATPLRTEQAAMRNIDPAASRSWRITNPSSTNQLGNPVAYKLLPQASPTFMVPENSPAGQRGGFARHNLWVTPYEAGEQYASAGAFSMLHPGGAGLPSYVQADRSVDDTEIVVWHTFGVTHVPRPEDWPVMPVEYTGFTLMPYGFFEQNPSLDVPPSAACHAGH
ncbi:MAG: primary-amine oxidase [Ilumatobacteraceae bacterium]|nr:primary-amine oxidase [Ilumatobacteraceae bacterium]